MTFTVPRYVSRVDIFEPGYAGTHGWQVRYQGTSSFFSDSRCSKDADPATSLRAARTYLAAIYRGTPSLVRQAPTARKRDPALPPGVRVVTRVRKGRTFEEVYVEAYSPQKGEPARRVYVGTENTATPARMTAAIAKAVLLRKELVEAHQIRAVLDGRA